MLGSSPPSQAISVREKYYSLVRYILKLVAVCLFDDHILCAIATERK